MTAIALPKLGLGGAGIGNLYAEVSDAAAQETVFAALDGGYGLIDTAPHYGTASARYASARRSSNGVALVRC